MRQDYGIMHFSVQIMRQNLKNYAAIMRLYIFHILLQNASSFYSKKIFIKTFKTENYAGNRKKRDYARDYAIVFSSGPY